MKIKWIDYSTISGAQKQTFGVKYQTSNMLYVILKINLHKFILNCFSSLIWTFVLEKYVFDFVKNSTRA